MINILQELILIYQSINYFSYNDTSLIDPILRDRITEIRINPLVTKIKLQLLKISYS